MTAQIKPCDKQRHILYSRAAFGWQPLAKLLSHLMIQLKVVWHRFLRILVLWKKHCIRFDAQPSFSLNVMCG
jgi:hypothetical protein